VIELDTPGGEVGAVLEICTLIKQSPVANTIAWIHPQAYSGGAIIALACREIVLSSAATMGDAAPIAVSPMAGLQQLAPTERQKILAPLLAEVVDSARMRGYDEKVVQGFLTLGVELWRIRDKQTGAQYFVDEQEYIRIFGETPARGSPRVASGAPSGTSGAADAGSGNDERRGPDAEQPSRRTRPPAEGSDRFSPASPSISQQTTNQVGQSIETVSTRPAFDRLEPERYELIEYASDGNTLLTLKNSELRAFGFADPTVTINTDAELSRFVGAQNLRRLDQSWSENLVAFMTIGASGTIVRGLLIVIFLMAIFIEMSVPGVGLAGGVALVALAGLIVPPMLMGASTWWALALILGGVSLLLLEVFVTPGFGVPGVLGLIMLMGGLVGTFAGAGQLFPGTGSGGGSELTWAISVVFLALFVAGVGMYFFTRYTDRFPLAGKLVLADRAVMSDDEEDSGMLSAMGPVASKAPVKIGEIGKTVTPLRPSGTAEFGDTFLDVVSEFGFIDAGQAVRVRSVTDYRIGVEAAAPGEAPATKGPGAPDRPSDRRV
jgi:membrane-bound serine protease (ClpP class)